MCARTVFNRSEIVSLVFLGLAASVREGNNFFKVLKKPSAADAYYAKSMSKVVLGEALELLTSNSNAGHVDRMHPLFRTAGGNDEGHQAHIRIHFHSVPTEYVRPVV